LPFLAGRLVSCLVRWVVGLVRPGVWQPPVACSRLEGEVIKRIKRARLFVWLREHRHELFDQAFQQELARAYQASPKGQPPVPPAQLGLATVLQAYTGASDDEVIEACVMDRRWQLVLDCMDHATAPFAKGTLVGFRARLIEHGLDRRLVERTVELYGQATGRVAGGRLRAALDSSPLWGAGRVEDTINLLGHALRKVVGVLARQQGWGLAEGTRVLAAQAGVPELAASSLKAALDLDWDDPAACQQALVVVLGAVERVERFAGQFAGQLAGSQPGSADPRVVEGLQAARQVRDQDTIVGGDGIARIRQGVARDRRISIEDPQMRHGRKTKSRRIDGYKRHVLTDLDTELVPAVGVTPANIPEAEVTEQITADLDAQQITLGELNIDRAYLSSSLVRDRDEQLQVFCKAFPVRAVGGRFTKTAFTIDFDQQLLVCPNSQTMAFIPGGKVQFPAHTCQVCPLRSQCTSSTRGRSVQIHPDERLLAELRQRQQTPQGRSKLRERTRVEHTLAHVGRWQGDRARYRGQRKNLFDLRRVAVVHNLHVIARQPPQSHQAA
jgi:transposase